MALFIGYLASAFLAVSLVVTNAFKFRWYSLGGQVTFIIYGLMINAMPVVIANAILLVINIFQMVRLYRSREAFDLVQIDTQDELISCFIKRNGKDLESYFPAFKNEADINNKAFITLRDLSIANLFIIRISDEGQAQVMVNYTIPKYRDYKVGRFIFEQEKNRLQAQGVKKITYNQVAHPGHAKFLTMLGFAKLPDGSYFKQLS
ncbi:MAG: hypothetical protein JSS90_07990 [Bacteroidetes bacterium]|jgi:hypothetical protein|nr:hypothetical protein [Bacteroidota bacterium]